MIWLFKKRFSTALYIIASDQQDQALQCNVRL